MIKIVDVIIKVAKHEKTRDFAIDALKQLVQHAINNIGKNKPDPAPNIAEKDKTRADAKPKAG